MCLSVDIDPPVVYLDGEAAGVTVDRVLDQRVIDGLVALTAGELPVSITSRFISITRKIVEEQARRTLPKKLGGALNALARSSCLNVSIET